jgi:hypothetical protein
VFLLVFDGSIIESWINSIVEYLLISGILERNGNTSAPAFRIPSVEISSPIFIKWNLLGSASNKGDWILGPFIPLCRPFWQLASPLQS